MPLQHVIFLSTYLEYFLYQNKTFMMEISHGEFALENIESKLGEILKTPEIFYKPQLENTVNIKQLSQKSYHVAASDELFKGKSLSKLLIDGFDEEQIWQQSDLLNKAASAKISDFINIFDGKYLSSVFPISSSNNKEKSKSSVNIQENKSTDKNGASFSSQESSAEEDYAFDDDSDSDTDFDTKLKKAHRKRKTTDCASDVDSDSDSSTDLKTKIKKVELSEDKSEYACNVDDDSHSSIEFGTKTEREQSPQKKLEYVSEVDDQFFKLSELENYLRIEEIKEQRGEDSTSDDDKINYFEDLPSDDLDITDDESEEEQGKTKKSARELKYNDFYKKLQSESQSKNESVLNDQNESLMAENEKYSYDESESNDEMETGEKDDDDEQKANSICNGEVKKTKFELEQEKTKKIIQECEKSMLEPLSWQLTGEVAADKRPVNSLLELEADFDCNTKQDFLVDKDLNEKVEEITIMAIRNKAFFDVERKFKPTEDIITYKKEAVLEQTKSKKSLAEVYEEDYLKKQHKQDTEEEENPKHKEIKKLMDSLFPQLHALFSHIPKPAIPEIKIVSNLPAITVEEVAPTNVSDATLLAPEEVKKKTGLVKGKTERTDTDRKRERRKKKIHQRLKEKKKLQKLESQKENPSAKVSKLEKIQALKKLKQHKNTKIASVDEGGKIKSSKDFFSRLQDTMDTKSKVKVSGKKIKNK